MWKGRAQFGPLSMGVVFNLSFNIFKASWQLSDQQNLESLTSSPDLLLNVGFVVLISTLELKTFTYHLLHVHRFPLWCL